MKILFDHGTPAPLRRQLAGHEISTAYEMGWAKLNNGDLLAAAEKSFDVSSRPTKICVISKTLPADGWRSWFCQRPAGRKFRSTQPKLPPV
jgi:hypothetical protein